MFFSGKGRTMTGLMPNTAQQALQSFFPLEPDWMAKAAAMKLPHRDERPPQPLTARQHTESIKLLEWICG